MNDELRVLHRQQKRTLRIQILGALLALAAIMGMNWHLGRELDEINTLADQAVSNVDSYVERLQDIEEIR